MAMLATLGLMACNVSPSADSERAPLALGKPGPFASVTLLSGWQNAPRGTRKVGVFFDPNSGIVHFSGALAGGTTSLLFMLAPEYRPETDVYVPVDLCHGHNGRLLIQPSGAVSIQTETSFADAQCFISLEGASYAPTSAGFSVLTLQNGWAPVPSNSFALFGTLGGAMRFRGAIASGTNAVAFTLPLEFRPASNVYIPVDLCNTSNGRLLIQPNGVATVQAEGGALANAECFTSLDGAWFVPNANGATPLTLMDGWTNAPYGTSAAAVENVAGIVHFKGAIAHAPAAGPQGVDLIAILPSGFAPSANVNLPIDTCNATKGELLIDTNGSVWNIMQPDEVANPECFTSLDGVSYSIAGFN
jgi:hypothetical protein